MRILPSNIKDKLNEQFQVASNNAQPNLRIISTQSNFNTLLSEPIHECNIPNNGDVTVRQLEGESSPSLAYSVCVDNGIATIYMREFPTTVDNPWIKLFELGSAIDAAIEYDGKWVLEKNKRWYILQTETLPYIFWVDTSGNLYVQKWSDQSTKFALDSGVTSVCSCKGWSNFLLKGLDQGLIVGYLKSGRAFYRSYAKQDNGDMVWEASKEITTLGDGISKLSVFRTNDFRIGFVAETKGQIRYTLTNRNYAGMSVRPETINLHYKKLEFGLYPIAETYTRFRENVSVGDIKERYFLLYQPSDISLAITKVEKINSDTAFESTGFKVFFNTDVYNLTSGVTISPLRDITTEYISAEKAFVIYVSPSIKRNLDVTITINASRSAYYFKNGNQKHPIEQLSITIPREIQKIYSYNNETVKLVVSNSKVYIDVACFNKLIENETIVITINSQMLLEPLSNIPI